MADRAMSQKLSEINTQEESQCRRWARENYVPIAERSLSWPLFVLDEMRRLDQPEAVKPPKLLLRVGRVTPP